MRPKLSLFTKMKPVSVMCLQPVKPLHMISLKPVSVTVFAENNASYFTLKANQIGSSRLSGGANGISGAVASLAIYPNEAYRFVYRENGY